MREGDDTDGAHEVPVARKPVEDTRVELDCGNCAANVTLDVETVLNAVNVPLLVKVCVESDGDMVSVLLAKLTVLVMYIVDMLIVTSSLAVEVVLVDPITGSTLDVSQIGMVDSKI